MPARVADHGRARVVAKRVMNQRGFLWNEKVDTINFVGYVAGYGSCVQ